jgi:hypothetical protein
VKFSATFTEALVKFHKLFGDFMGDFNQIFGENVNYYQLFGKINPLPTPTFL